MRLNDPYYLGLASVCCRKYHFGAGDLRFRVLDVILEVSSFQTMPELYWRGIAEFGSPPGWRPKWRLRQHGLAS